MLFEHLAALVNGDRLLELDVAFSSRVTMLSSSFSARSKVISLMSACLVCVVDMTVSMLRSDALPFELRAGIHQRFDVNRNRARQRVEVVAAFERRHDATVAMPLGRIGELLRGPQKVGFDQPQVRQRVSLVGIEAGRHDKYVRTEIMQGGKNARFERLAELLAPIAGPQRRIVILPTPRSFTAPVPGNSGISCVEP